MERPFFKIFFLAKNANKWFLVLSKKSNVVIYGEMISAMVVATREIVDVFFLGGNESFLEKGKGENLCVKILKIKIGREPGRGTFAQCAILSE